MSPPVSRRNVLLTGSTGYVGRKLLPLLLESEYSVRCLARNRDKLSDAPLEPHQVISGDVLDPGSLRDALAGIETAYYLIHLMGSSKDFETKDRQAAENFSAAAKEAGVQRIIYLGGLGDENDEKLSPHLRSRHEVGRILRSSGVETIEFRASVLIGKGSLSFELIRRLCHRLPIMICPRWLATPTQPIATQDVLSYLLTAAELPLDGSEVFEIGGEDVVTYGDMIREYARQQNLRRWLIPVPVLTPYLSSLWLSLVTPAEANVGRHLVEGLKNPTIVTNQRALNQFEIRPMGITEAMKLALADQREEVAATK